MKKINIRRSLAAAVAGSLSLAAAAQQAAETTTVQAVAAHAVETNPEVQAAWHEFLAAEDARRSARGGYFPRLDLDARGGREEQELVDADTTLEFDHRAVGLTVTQMLWDGLFTRSEVRSADYVRRTRYYEVRNTAEAAALEAFRAYQDVQRYRELVALAQQNYDSHVEVYDQIAERVRAGISRSVDLEQVTGRVALAQSNLITEQSNLHDVSARYERVIGRIPPETMAEVPGMDQGLPATIGEALDQAYAGHPAIIAASENIQARKYVVNSAESGYWPRLDLRLRSQRGEDIDRIAGRTNNDIAELVLSYNLFRGGSDKADADQARDQTEVARFLRDQTCRDVRQNLRIAFNDTQRLQEQLQHLNVHRLSTEKTREVYRDQFTIGQRTLLDLLDTENETFDSRRAYAEAIYDRSIAVARTLASMGRLLEALGIARRDMQAAGGRLSEGGASRSQLCPHMDRVESLVATKAAPVILDSDRDGVTDDKDLCPGTPPGVEVDEFGCEKKKPIVLNGVKFEWDSARLLPVSRTILDKAAKTLLAHPDLRVEIGGHTDSTGTKQYNFGLSARRANAVLEYLAGKGVARGRMVPTGYGEGQPVAPNDTEDGRAQNRRVEFIILDR